MTTSESELRDLLATCWVIAGTGTFVDADSTVTEVQPDCRLDAPAAWLHRDIAGPTRRIVLCANLPGDEWAMPINRDPAERPHERHRARSCPTRNRTPTGTQVRRRGA